MINMLVKSRASIERIQSFLDTPNVIGLPDTMKDDFDDSERSYDSPLTSQKKDNNKKKSTLNGSIEMKNLTVAWRTVDVYTNHEKKEEEEEENDEVDEDFTSSSCSSTAVLECLQRSSQICFTSKQRRSKKSSSTTSSSSSSSTIMNNTDYQLLDRSEHGTIELIQDDMIDDQKSSSQASSAKEYEVLPDIESNVSTTTIPTTNTPMKSTEAYTIVLHGMNLSIPSGALVAIVGATGSGKSSFIQGALLGEALLIEGYREMYGKLSYTSQSAWIQNATLKDNVLFGETFDAKRLVKIDCLILIERELERERAEYFIKTLI
jgi:ABC-type multidrug transport system fused ATPase/permease subunit